MSMWTGQHADVDWATFQANNATDLDSANIDRIIANVLLLTSANMDWSSADAEWVTVAELYVTDWASVDADWVTG
jgi:hypothetical protein